MLTYFLGNLRETCGNRPGIKLLNTCLRKLSVDGICTASVATGDPENDTKNRSSVNFVQF